MLEITDKDFEREVLQSSIPVLVDFWGYGCGPCKIVEPILVQLAQEFKDKIKTVKINVNDNDHVVFQYSIKAIPTILLFQDGKVSSQFNDGYTLYNLRRFITKGI